MIVLDLNLLVYAYDSTCPQHAAARDWIEQVFSGSEPVGLPWATLHGFLRILTFPTPGAERLTMLEATGIVRQWLDLPHVRTLAPGEGHWALYQQMLLEGDVRGRLAAEAHLAALAIEHGGVLCTTDRDFARFPGLRWRNPLAELPASAQ